MFLENIFDSYTISCCFCINYVKTCRRSGVFIVNFDHIPHLFLVFLLLSLNK